MLLVLKAQQAHRVQLVTLVQLVELDLRVFKDRQAMKAQLDRKVLLVHKGRKALRVTLVIQVLKVTQVLKVLLVTQVLPALPQHISGLVIHCVSTTVLLGVLM